MTTGKRVTLATRPRTTKRTVGFRLDDETIAMLDEYADEHGIDRSAALRLAVESLTGHKPADPDWGWRRGVPSH